MDEVVKGPRDYIALFRRRKWRLVLPIVILSGVSAAASILWPPTYRSSATVLIEEPEVPRELVQSTITSFASQRLQVIQQRVMTTRNLIKIIEKYGLYREERKRTPMPTLVLEFAEDISMELVSAEVVDPRSGRPTMATIAFKLIFDHRSPAMAQKVVNELVSFYLAENLRNRRKKTAETTRFLEQEAARLSREISEVETKLATFKQKNARRLPEQLAINLRLIDRTEIELRDVVQRMQAVQEQNIFLDAQLTQISPFGTIIVDGQPVMSPHDQLKALRTKYVSLSGQYASRHPDIRRIRREIAALETETDAGPDVTILVQQLESIQAELTVGKEKYGPAHPDVAKLERQVTRLQSAIDDARKTNKNGDTRPQAPPDNPAYIQIETRLNAANVELQSLREQQKLLKSNLAQYEERVYETPEVERASLLLKRDYNNAYAKFQEIRNKQLEARLAESLEAERKSERFSLIEPPQLPLEPIKPNRIAIVLLGFVLSFGAGVGNVLLWDAMDQRVYGSKQLTALVGAAPLVVVPYIEIGKDRRRTWWKRILVLTVLLTVVIGAATFGANQAPLPGRSWDSCRRGVRSLRALPEWVL